jgi:hypothetical protein
MKEVRIEYPFLFLFRKTQIIQVPEEWVDLTGRQFAVCCRMFTEPITDIQFITAFFGIKKFVAKRLEKFHQYKLIELVGFIANPKAMTNFFYLTDIPGTGGLKAPDKRLHGVTFEQFMFFDTFFFDYINTLMDNDLVKFIAALYLKSGEKITAIDFKERVKFVAKNVDKLTQYAIFLNYTFIRKWLSKAYPLLFGFTGDDSDKPKKESIRPKKPNRPDWNSIFDGLVGEDIIHEEQYRHIPCTVAFRTINKRIQNYKKYGK